MSSYGGRPHWGKRHYLSEPQLRERYPEWDTFQAVRERLDPGRRLRERLHAARARARSEPAREVVRRDPHPVPEVEAVRVGALGPDA